MSESVATGLRGFVARRRSLRDEYNRILRVQMEAAYLVEELRRRRDGMPPQSVDLTYLRAAVAEVAVDDEGLTPIETGSLMGARGDG